MTKFLTKYIKNERLYQASYVLNSSTSKTILGYFKFAEL